MTQAENPPAAQDEFEKHPDEPHHYVWHMKGVVSVGICDLNGCGEIAWDELDREVGAKIQAAVGGSWQAKLVRDLPRCPHGRIDGDTCGGWRGPGPFDGGCYGGVSAGNPNFPVGRVFAWGLSAIENYAMPMRADRNDPEAWKIRA